MADGQAGTKFTAVVPVTTDTASVRLLVDGEDRGIAPAEGSEARFVFADGLPKGTYNFVGVPLNEEGEGPPSDPSVLALAGRLPGKPGLVTFQFEVV